MGTTGTVTGKCSWNVQANTSVQGGGPCYECNNQDSANAELAHCRVKHVESVLKPLAANWNAWMVGPARQWAAMAQSVCSKYASPSTNLATRCDALQAVVERVPSDASMNAWSTELPKASQVACAADYGQAIGEPACCGQPGLINPDTVANYSCHETLPTCVNYVFNSHWGYCMPKASQVACAGNYGQKIGDPVCCGQAGTIDSAGHTCGEMLPTCVGYVLNSHWGYCVGNAAPNTSSCLTPKPQGTQEKQSQ